MAAPRRSTVDGPLARVAAVVVALLLIATAIWIGRVGFAGAPLTPFERMADEPVSAAQDNPQLAACLEERIGAVNQMRDDGVINDGQYSAFRARAVAYCETQFPAQSSR